MTCRRKRSKTFLGTWKKTQRTPPVQCRRPARESGACGLPSTARCTPLCFPSTVIGLVRRQIHLSKSGYEAHLTCADRECCLEMRLVLLYARIEPVQPPHQNQPPPVVSIKFLSALELPPSLKRPTLGFKEAGHHGRPGQGVPAQGPRGVTPTPCL